VTSQHPIPKKLADFEIEAQLGTGGMAEVFLAKKRGAEGTYKRLVVKRILETHGSSQRFRTMFAEEAQLATRLNHPNIVQVYDFQDYGADGPLLSMEYVEGPDLKKLGRAARAKGKRLSPYIAAYIVSEVAKGLHYAHERKDEGGNPLDIVHRDVSPQNILLSFDGSVKIADFGIATANLFRQETGVLKGKTAYMSPEQAKTETVDRRSDIYSLGVVFHELLTGRPLHGAVEGKELLEAVRAGSVEPPNLYVRGVPPQLEAIVMKALELERDRRYATAREMSSAITHALFECQKLVDSQVLEAAIAEFVERSSLPLNVAQPLKGQRETHEAASTADSESHEGSASAHARPRVGREVRHVSIVSLRIHGRAEVEAALGKAQTSRLADQLRSILDDIAFKQGTRWTWEDEESYDGQTAVTLGGARAVVGLTANPSRAASDAAWLAVLVHEAISGACDGLAQRFLASVCIVRAVAEGRRDGAGHLVQYTVHSPAEELATLLCLRTQPGHTWAAGGIFRLLRRDFVWNDAPSIELDTLAAPKMPAAMRVYSLERPLTRQEQKELLSLAPRDLVGRDAELADLHAAYHQSVTQLASGGSGQTIARAVVGELGIGKTALVTTFLGELPPDARELHVECSPYRSELPFANAALWLRELSGVQNDDSAEQARQAIAEALGQIPGETKLADIIDRMTELVLGQLIEATDEADAALHRRLLSIGLRHIFARAARQSPVVMMVDGLQWIDLPSLDFLASMARRGDRLPILLLLVTRPEGRVLPSLEGIVRLDLVGLSTDNLQRLIEAHVEASSGVHEACGDLIPRAAGNPFFLLEMVDSLLERGGLELKRAEADDKVTLVRVRAGSGADALPSTLEQLLADRLNELPVQERSLIDWLAVSGCPLSEGDLSALLDVDSQRLHEILSFLGTRGVVDSRLGAVDVRHPLTRDVAYLALSANERTAMHRQLGERLADSVNAKGLGAALVAKHLSSGGDSIRAADYYLEAAAMARLSFQLPLAARYYRSALEVLPSNDVRRLEPYSVLEEICRMQGRWRDRKQYLESLRTSARQLGDPTWLATALIRHAQFEFDTGQFARCIALAKTGEEVASVAHSPMLRIQAQSLSAEARRDLGDMAGALGVSARALEAAARFDIQPRLKAEIFRTQATLLVRVGRVHEAIATHAEAVAVARQTGARRLEARAKSSLSYAVYVLGRYEDAITLALEAIRIDLSIGGRFQIAKTLSNIAQAYAALGELERAEGYFKRAVDAHERYEDQDCKADTLLCRADLLLQSDRSLDCRAVLRKLDALGGIHEGSYDAVHADIVRARLALNAGDNADAVLCAASARRIASAQGYTSFHALATAVEAAACVASNEIDAGVLLARESLRDVERLQGCEYALEVRSYCLEALEKAQSPHAFDAQGRAADHTLKVFESIRDPALRKAFAARAVVKRLLRAPQSSAL
jgi:eukaryotic-like serine/threonine-protein kinase